MQNVRAHRLRWAVSPRFHCAKGHPISGPAYLAIIRFADFVTVASFAEIVAVTCVVTATVVTVNFTVVAPPGTVTVAGTTASVLLLTRVMTTPEVGAGPDRVTVPVEEMPPTTVVGFNVRLERTAGVMVRVAVFDVEPKVADTVTAVWATTPAVVTVNVADVFPAAIVTVPATLAATLLLARDTEIPPDGAAAPIVTVPVEFLPPRRDVGLSVNAVIAGGLIVKVAVWDTPFKLPVIVAAV